MANPSGPLNGQGRVVEGLVNAAGTAGLRLGGTSTAITGATNVGMPTVVEGLAGGVALPVSLDGIDVYAFNSSANSAFSLSLPAVAGKTNYITGFEISGGGATAVSIPQANITGITAAAILYTILIPAGALTSVVNFSIEFTRPIPASAANTAITLNIPAFGAGNLLQAAFLHGFYK